jgi:hypothetical protein
MLVELVVEMCWYCLVLETALSKRVGEAMIEKRQA